MAQMEDEMFIMIMWRMEKKMKTTMLFRAQGLGYPFR